MPLGGNPLNCQQQKSDATKVAGVLLEGDAQDPLTIGQRPIREVSSPASTIPLTMAKSLSHSPNHFKLANLAARKNSPLASNKNSISTALVIDKSFPLSPSSRSLNAPVSKAKRKLNISDVKWDNDETYIRIFLPCQKSLDLSSVKYNVLYSDHYGTTELLVEYPGHEFTVSICKQILPDLEAKKIGRNLIIRLTKIYPADHWSLLCSRDYHANGAVTFYVNNFFKKTLTSDQIMPYLPSSPFNSLENIIVERFNESERDILDIMLNELILHEMRDKASDLGYAKLCLL